MKPSLLLSFLVLAAFASCRPAAQDQIVESAASAVEAAMESRGPLVIRNVTVIDGTGSPPRAGVDVVIVGETIDRVLPAGQPVDSDSRVIDGTGKFLIPGLVDMHAHLLLHPWNEKGEILPRYDRDAALTNLGLFLQFGVTAVRDPGAPTADAVMLRDLVRRKKVRGPRIFTAGRILNSSSFNPEPFVTVRSAQEVRDEIAWQKNAGVDAVKIYSSMPPDLVEVAIEEANRHGLPVIGHLQRTTWTEAALMGIDGLEHAAPWSPEYLRADARGEYSGSLFARAFWLENLDDDALDEMIAALAASGVVVDPTLMAVHTKFWGNDDRYTKSRELSLVPEIFRRGWTAGSFTASWTPQQYSASKKAWPLLLDLTRRMHEAGVHLVTGTDTPTPWIIPGVSLHQEMELLSDAGIPPLSILRMATHDAARALRSEREFGSIAPGLRADLVLLSKDPLETITNTRSIELVIQNGEVVFPHP